MSDAFLSFALREQASRPPRKVETCHPVSAGRKIGPQGSGEKGIQGIAAMHPRHALIIEDEILIAMEVEALLKEQGFETVDIADSPMTALDSALRRRPDLITADYRIVGGTGVEAVSKIMAHLGPIPVVYVTGNASCLSAETSPVVSKPILPRALADAWQGAIAA